MNCKPGDYAIMTKVNGHFTRPNLGRLCRVTGPDEVHFYPEEGDLFCWNVELDGSHGVNIYGNPIKDGHYPDKYLKPLPGVVVEQAERDEVTA